MGLWAVEAPKLSLDNQLTDGGQVASFTRRPPLTLQEDSWYSFVKNLSRPHGHSAAGRIRSNEKKNPVTSGPEPATSGL
jgi:hypothetical protein